MDKFAAREGTEEDIRSVRTGMVGGLVTIYGTAVAFPLVFKKKGLVPAVAHATIGTLMFAIYASRIGWDRLLTPTISAKLQNNVNSSKVIAFN